MHAAATAHAAAIPIVAYADLTYVEHGIHLGASLSMSPIPPHPLFRKDALPSGRAGLVGINFQGNDFRLDFLQGVACVGRRPCILG